MVDFTQFAQSASTSFSPEELDQELDMEMDLTDVPDRTLIPVGFHTAKIEHAVLENSRKDPSNRFVTLRFRTKHGTCFGRINVVNKSSQAVDIGKQTLKKILISAGKPPAFKSVKDFIGLIVGIQIVHEDGENGPREKIKFYDVAKEELNIGN